MRLQRLVNEKDTFTKIKQEREVERDKLREQETAVRNETNARRQQLTAIKQDLFALFGYTDPYNRASEFESALSRLFNHYGILIREPFRVKVNGQTIEQIDGLIELDSRLFLVELKWLKGNVEKADAFASNSPQICGAIWNNRLLPVPVGIDTINVALGGIVSRAPTAAFCVSD